MAPVARRPRKPPGTGWLLGLHAPAAASLGRFGHALGADALGAIAELEAAERRARPHEVSRRRRLRAHAGADRSRGAPEDVAPDARAVALERRRPEAAPTASWRPRSSSWSPIRTRRMRSALRERATGTPIVPASFARLRSRTAPAGIARLAGGLEPVAPARVVGAAARPAGGARLHSAALPRRLRDRARQLAAARRRAHARRDPALAPGRGGPAPRAGGRRRRAAARRSAAPTAAADLADHERVFEISAPARRDRRPRRPPSGGGGDAGRGARRARAPGTRAARPPRFARPARCRRRRARPASRAGGRSSCSARRDGRTTCSRGCYRRSAPASTRARSIAGSSSATSMDPAAGTTCASACRRRAGTRRRVRGPVARPPRRRARAEAIVTARRGRRLSPRARSVPRR